MNDPVTPATDEAAGEPADPHRPAVNQEAFDCPRCGAYAHMTWATIGPRRGTMIASDFDDALWSKATCSRCGLPSVWRGVQKIYPLRRIGQKPHPDMPGPVRELHEEASAVACVSRRAGAALARATVELLLKHLDPEAPTRAKLDKRIERIKARGVSTSLGQMLDVIRVAGNGALHVDDEPGELVVLALDDREGPELLELFLKVTNDLVEELITKPAVTRGLWDKLPSGVKGRLGK